MPSNFLYAMAGMAQAAYGVSVQHQAAMRDINMMQLKEEYGERKKAKSLEETEANRQALMASSIEAEGGALVAKWAPQIKSGKAKPEDIATDIMVSRQKIVTAGQTAMPGQSAKIASEGKMIEKSLADLLKKSTGKGEPTTPPSEVGPEQEKPPATDDGYGVEPTPKDIAAVRETRLRDVLQRRKTQIKGTVRSSPMGGDIRAIQNSEELKAYAYINADLDTDLKSITNETVGIITDDKTKATAEGLDKVKRLGEKHPAMLISIASDAYEVAHGRTPTAEDWRNDQGLHKIASVAKYKDTPFNMLSKKEKLQAMEEFDKQTSTFLAAIKKPENKDDERLFTKEQPKAIKRTTGIEHFQNWVGEWKKYLMGE